MQESPLTSQVLARSVRTGPQYAKLDAIAFRIEFLVEDHSVVPETSGRRGEPRVHSRCYLFTRESAFELVLSPPSSRRSSTPASCRRERPRVLESPGAGARGPACETATAANRAGAADSPESSRDSLAGTSPARAPGPPFRGRPLAFPRSGDTSRILWRRTGGARSNRVA